MPAMVSQHSPFLNSASCALLYYVSSLPSLNAGEYTQHPHRLRRDLHVQAESAPMHGGFPCGYKRQSDTINPGTAIQGLYSMQCVCQPAGIEPVRWIVGAGKHTRYTPRYVDEFDPHARFKYRDWAPDHVMYHLAQVRTLSSPYVPGVSLQADHCNATPPEHPSAQKMDEEH